MGIAVIAPTCAEVIPETIHMFLTLTDFNQFEKMLTPLLPKATRKKCAKIRGHSTRAEAATKAVFMFPAKKQKKKNLKSTT